jgi:peptidoglycan/LPS O-acetylase OafA/YrhL
MPTEKIQNIQALRGIAVLLVVFFHVQIVEEKYAQYDFISPDFFIIGMSGVDLFFVISGFVMVIVTHRSFQSSGKIRQFLYHRITRIYPLYWFYSSLVLCVYLIQPTLVNSSVGNQVNIISSYLLLPQDLPPLINVGWTLILEMYFYFVFALLLLLPKEKFLFGIIAWGSSLVIIDNYFNYLNETNNPFLYYYANPLILEFIGGCLIAIMYKRQYLFGSPLFFALLSFFLWILGYYYFQELLSGDMTKNSWLRVFVFGVPAMLAVYASILFEKKEGALMPRWLRSIGDASYSIYLSHLLVLTVIGKIWLYFATEGIVDNTIMLLLMFTAVLIAGFLSYTFIERPMLIGTKAFEKKHLTISNGKLNTE